MSENIYTRILTVLDASYPEWTTADSLHSELSDVDTEIIRKEVFHLKEVGLIESTVTVPAETQKPVFHRAKIKAKGRDYLKPDGGLSAEINTVLVKLHAQTIKDLINTHIEAAQIDRNQKDRMKDAVKNLPAQSLQDIVTHFLSKGLEGSPNAINWLQQLIG